MLFANLALGAKAAEEVSDITTSTSPRPRNGTRSNTLEECNMTVIADDDWTFFEHTGLHYRYFESTQTWPNANCSCVASAPRGYTGNLASVHDNTTNTFA